MRSLKSVAFFFVAACFFVICGVLSAQDKPEVETLTAEKGVSYDSETKVLTDKITKCSLTLATAPSSKLVRSTTPYGTMMVRSHMADLGDMVVTMTQTKHPAKLLEKSKIDLEKDADKFVEMACNFGVQRRKGSKVQSRRKLTLQGAPGIEQAVAFPDDEKGAYTAGLSIQRTYVKDGLLYVVMVDLSKEVFEKDPKAAQEKVLSVLDSFAFLTK